MRIANDRREPFTSKNRAGQRRTAAAGNGASPPIARPPGAGTESHYGAACGRVI